MYQLLLYLPRERFTWLTRPTAVSYTHLDVYKRQQLVLPWIEDRDYLRNKKLKVKSINTPGYKG